ncbi:MAG: hypothetical protein CSA74_02330 [Rhodobacterales bacterium]|nr:MAG: hypothetical protein CSA74_02330 [Rhodobacterales bacterium]
MKRLTLILCLVLAGCSAKPQERPGDRVRLPLIIGLEPDGEGLAVGGIDGTDGQPGGGRIDFGRAPEGVIATIEREFGPGRALGLGGCPAAIRQQIAWGDLVLTFTEEQFVGWRAQDTAEEAGRTCGGTLA